MNIVTYEYTYLGLCDANLMCMKTAAKIGTKHTQTLFFRLNRHKPLNISTSTRL